MTYTKIEWTVESRIDGLVILSGFAYPDEGAKFGHFEFEATAEEIHHNEFTDIEITEEKFIPKV